MWFLIFKLRVETQFGIKAKKMQRKLKLTIMINNELHQTTNNNSIRNNLRPASSLLGFISEA